MISGGDIVDIKENSWVNQIVTKLRALNISGRLGQDGDTKIEAFSIPPGIVADSYILVDSVVLYSNDWDCDWMQINFRYKSTGTYCVITEIQDYFLGFIPMSWINVEGDDVHLFCDSGSDNESDRVYTGAKYFRNEIEHLKALFRGAQ